MAGAATPCSVVRLVPEGSKGDDDVFETVARIGGILASEGGGEAVVVVESLRELQGVRMTFEALEATKIGRAVNALRKSAPSEQARRLAAALVRGWKALADERFTSSRTTPPPPPQHQQPKYDKGTVKRSSSPSPPPLPVDAEHSARPEGESDHEMAVAPTSVVGVDSGADVIKQRSSRIRVVNINAPGKAADQRRVPVERRVATAAAPEPAVPAANTTRNGGGSNPNQQVINCPATASGHQDTNNAAKRVTPTSAAPLTMTTGPPTTALPKPVGSSGGCKRKAEATAVFDEARLAKARKRLIEGYKEASAVKEKRKPKEIKVIAGPGKKPTQCPPGRVAVRCTAAHRTGKQAPVPCRPRMPRAF